MKKILYVAFLLLCAVVRGKEKEDTVATIYGKVTEKQQAGQGYIRAVFSPNVLLVTMDGEKTDSSYTVADKDGIFIFKNIRPQRVYLKLFSVGKKTVEGVYELDSGRNVFYFNMEDAPQEIEEASVTAEIPLMRKIADTTVYNAAAVRTMDGESLKAVLEQFPGFTLTKNDIFVDGEPVKRTYVNGVLIFGDNPMAAVNALNADEVSQVRVYAELSAEDKRRGLKNSRKQTVLDVVTKEPIFQLSEAGILAEGGMDETGQLRYSGAGALAYYSEMMQLSANVYAENVNASIGNGYETFGESDVRIALKEAEAMDKLSFYRENIGANVKLDKYWKDRDYGNSVKGKYKFERKYTKSTTAALTEYFANGANPAMSAEDNFSDRSVGSNHEFYAGFDLKDTPLKSLFLSVKGTVSDMNTSSLSTEDRIVGETGSGYSRHEENGSDIRDYNLATQVRWANNDAKKVRTSLNVDFAYSNSNTLSWSVDTLHTSFDRRHLVSDGFGKGLDGNMSFNLSTVLVNTDKRYLSMNASVKSLYMNTRKRQLTTDAFGVEIPVTDLANTYDYTWNMFTNSVEASFAYNSKNFSMNGGVALRNDIQIDDEYYPDALSYDRNYWSVMPNLSLRYKTLLLTASVSPSMPSLEQTRNRISDSNPLVLTGGNPDLKPSYDTKMTLQLSQPIAKNYGRINVNVSGACSFGRIVTKTMYFSENTVLSQWDGYEALAGSMLYTFENASIPAWSISANAAVTGLMAKRKISATARLLFGLSAYPQYYGNELIGVKDLNPGVAVNLSYRPVRSLNFVFSGSSTYMKSTDADGSLLSERIASTAGIYAYATFAKNGNFDLSYKLVAYDYLGGVGNDFLSHGLDAALGWSFLKRSLKVYVKGIDLLNSGSIYSNIVTADSSVQRWTPVYGRYFMIGVQYLFRRKN